MTFKKPDPTQKIYHYIEIDSTTIALYDSLMDKPISYGSKVKIQVDINKLLPKDITIYYYTLKQLIKLKPKLIIFIEKLILNVILEKWILGIITIDI